MKASPAIFGGGSTPTIKAFNALQDEAVGLQLRGQKCRPDMLIRVRSEMGFDVCG
ncbi:MAG: hypothetical protein ACUVTB_07350 [Candidatus Bathycorpusculaceae bacterium]